MSQISLTAPMRSTLLALQNIARQQDIVQNRLATGLKVSSAIDNPSSYYTAASLSNRAADLTALLDAMSQGVQTIKTASEAITSATKFLEQAKATANQALESAIPAKSWFEEQVGANGAVVTTAQELQNAVKAGKETICVYGKISLENNNIVLKSGQKLVGTEYFTRTSVRSADGKRFSQLDIVSSQSSGGVNLVGNNLVADIDITYENDTNLVGGTVDIKGTGNIVQNVSLAMRGTKNGGSLRGAVLCQGEVTLYGEINLTALGGNNVNGIGNYNGHTIIDKSATVSIVSNSNGGYGVINYTNSTLDVYGKIFAVLNSGPYGMLKNNTGIYAGNQTHLHQGAEIYVKGDYSWGTTSENNLFIIDSGVKIGTFAKAQSEAHYFITTARSEFTNSVTLDFNYFQNNSNIFEAIAAISWDDDKISDSSDSFQASYVLLLNQYDNLLNDAFYKGINLLQGQNLQINFNEDRSSKVEVKGVKADSESLGLVTKEWTNAGDIEKSISELESAISSLRSFASAFGNYYSIVTTRQDFTENLINVLEEGADKLTLADMNEESANMLALQTSQQLAINSLSLASQAAQSVLKLF